MTTLTHPWDRFVTKIQAAPDSTALDALEQEIFGRKAGALTTAMKSLGSETPEKRKELGQSFNAIKIALESAIAERKTQLDGAAMGKLATDDALDITLSLPAQEQGHLHPVHSFIAKAQEVFGRMGFDAAEGPELETEEFNFNKLNIPADHPARDMQDTFWVSLEDRTVMRTHTSSVQIHYMLAHKPPFRMICTGKVYRKDSDATHSPMFHQIEGLMIGKNVSLANMKGVMETAIKELVNPNLEFRWRTGFFPFVEPGLEMDVKWQGDESKSKEGKWLEMLGCGMVHPNVLKNVGIDPDEWQGFAFGMGVERMIMIKHQIPDLRLFYGGDLRFLKQF
ncbi:MAG: phenylalanine--tRNA ligase subunit alpha [Candidatus Peribacteraceae bacterium]|nr:phenylalanine--tRNA ligase subunit alpha [Candidatus Peribacteraceae bacterium]